MGERPLAVTVAHGPDVVDSGPQLIVDGDVSPGVRCHAGLFETKVVGVGHAPDRDQQVRARYNGTAGADRHPVAVFRYPNIAGTQVDCDALTFENVLDGGADVVVFARGKSRPAFDDRDLGAEPAEHLRELETDVAAADDHQMLWHRVEVEDADVREVIDVGQTGDIRGRRTAAGVEENLLTGDLLVTDLQRVWVEEACVPA